MYGGKVKFIGPMLSSCHIFGRSVIAEILRFNSFQMAAVRHLAFLKLDILTELL